MIRLAVLVPILALSACQVVQETARFTAADAKAAASIAVAFGQPTDAKCWTMYATGFAAVEKQAANKAVGAASAVALQRGVKGVASNYDCLGITTELAAALAAIPTAGPIAIQILGF